MNARSKTEIFSQWFNGLAGMALVCALVGCASTGYDRGDAAAQSLQNTASGIQAESLALDTTLAALKDLVNHPAADLKVQFHVYEAAMDQLVAAADRAQSAGRVMRSKNEAYLQAWDKQLAEMNYEHIRKSSEARRTEVSSQFESVDKRYEELHSAIEPLVAYLRDVQKALSADLTREGLDAVKPIVAKADENAARVQTALGKLATDLSVSGTRLSSVVVQSPPENQRDGAVQTEAVTTR
jgi:chromosome segregation ATPase